LPRFAKYRMACLKFFRNGCGSVANYPQATTLQNGIMGLSHFIMLLISFSVLLGLLTSVVCKHETGESNEEQEDQDDHSDKGDAEHPLSEDVETEAFANERVISIHSMEMEKLLYCFNRTEYNN
jgi:hypothetical protein